MTTNAEREDTVLAVTTRDLASNELATATLLRRRRWRLTTIAQLHLQVPVLRPVTSLWWLLLVRRRHVYTDVYNDWYILLNVLPVAWYYCLLKTLICLEGGKTRHLPDLPTPGIQIQIYNVEHFNFYFDLNKHFIDIYTIVFIVLFIYFSMWGWPIQKRLENMKR